MRPDGVRRGAYVTIGVAFGFILFGALIVTTTGRDAMLRVCRPAGFACNIRLAAWDVFDFAYSPGGVVMILGLLLLLVSVGALLRQRITKRK